MNPLYILNRAGWILALGSVIALVGWLNAYDTQVDRLAQQRYCENVATWMVEAKRGIDPLHRTGHPDYEGIAAEQCPGLRPAYPAETQPRDPRNERQLAQE